ncbi:hypothetical protein P3X46_010927 [Hevea brasiliensis]|uniref:Fe2OG dioxygenase domain-containing protein n=1 Tax=Hevea brasiliensis TaxID=3981 RepID=A0ABQ9MFK5_HEVBR|nr:probable 2-oxoglutarate-dependent dioxygenase AOP1 [Hevea brasiliensis]KAJ9179104.1 hypothetical protein P3X46_010927 [Hevea brasiliensis]
MGPLSSPLRLPVIDFSKENLRPGTSSWASTCKEVIQALEEYGCFEAVYDKVPLELHKTFFNLLEELYDLPLEIKRKNVSDIPYHGYVGNQPFTPSVYQGMGINNAATLEGTQDFTNAIWPNGNDDFCKTALHYSKLIAELEQMVMKMVFESYGVVQSHEDHQESITYLFRMMKYRVPEKDEDDVGVPIHTDKCFIAALHQNEVSGLELRTKDGQWIVFEPSSPSSFVVNAGDALMAWSNDRIHAPLHRVVMRGSKAKARYSVGIFSFHKGIIQVPEELVDEQHPLRFKPFNNFDLLRYYTTKEGQAQENTLKAYCGI